MNDHGDERWVRMHGQQDALARFCDIPLACCCCLVVTIPIHKPLHVPLTGRTGGPQVLLKPAWRRQVHGPFHFLQNAIGNSMQTVKHCRHGLFKVSGK